MVPRASWYSWQPKAESGENPALLRQIDEIYTECPCYGSRKLAWEANRRLGQPINRKRVQRLMDILGIQGLVPNPATSRPAPDHACGRTPPPPLDSTAHCPYWSQTPDCGKPGHRRVRSDPGPPRPVPAHRGASPRSGTPFPTLPVDNETDTRSQHRCAGNVATPRLATHCVLLCYIDKANGKKGNTVAVESGILRPEPLAWKWSEDYSAALAPRGFQPFGILGRASWSCPT
ncbi:MAG: IS3 family transposase, partial [Bryobacter sp.]|nr:IS3 family transposase [Bryobacter sp. CoA8 C33]